LRLTERLIVPFSGELDEASASEFPAIAACFVSVSHPIGVYPVGDFFGLAGVGLRFFYGGEVFPKSDS